MQHCHLEALTVNRIFVIASWVFRDFTNLSFIQSATAVRSGQNESKLQPKILASLKPNTLILKGSSKLFWSYDISEGYHVVFDAIKEANKLESFVENLQCSAKLAAVRKSLCNTTMLDSEIKWNAVKSFKFLQLVLAL